VVPTPDRAEHVATHRRRHYLEDHLDGLTIGISWGARCAMLRSIQGEARSLSIVALLGGCRTSPSTPEIVSDLADLFSRPAFFAAPSTPAAKGARRHPRRTPSARP
jgi:hypothetical protein